MKRRTTPAPLPSPIPTVTIAGPDTRFSPLRLPASVGTIAAGDGGAPSLDEVIENLDPLLSVLPDDVAAAVRRLNGDRSGLIEIVLDLDRVPTARTTDGDLPLLARRVGEADIRTICARIAPFDGDNRAGLSGTLHRISAMRNRAGTIVGLTCRVGRAVPGAAAIIADLVVEGRSILVLGKPGSGKTTVLREAARIAAAHRRVIVVDTSNEIAGDGDVPHTGIGRARRMQVPAIDRQHAVMIEAVENHTPQAIVVDEIGTEREAAAARTIAERGVQLIATAHGAELGGLLLNPTLADLAGGVSSVVLGDDEARRRGSRKAVLERTSPPTFGALVELLGHGHVAVYHELDRAVDTLLRGEPAGAEERRVIDGALMRRDRPSWGDPARFRVGEEHDELFLEVAPRYRRS